MKNPNDLIDRIAELYAWIDAELQKHPIQAGQCRRCGRCCDFEAYDHRLFITTPELYYFRERLGRRRVRVMTEGVCPYREEGLCSIHAFRFAGCRIFCSHGDPEYQAQLTEYVLARLKALCREYDVPYRYMDLKTALDHLRETDAVAL